MNTLKALAATVALVGSSTPPALAAAAAGGHGGGAHVGAGRGAGFGDHSGFRGDGRSHFANAFGGWGFGHTAGAAPWGFRRQSRYDRRGLGWEYGYGGYPFADTDFSYGDASYGAAPQPGPFGPPPPYGGFAGGYAPHWGAPASTLAPMAYGSGAHDGAYAYGYNGYAQTPALPEVGPAGYWLFPDTPVCGC